MPRHRLVLACGDYDRTRALADGSVRPSGIELTYVELPVEETFFRMLRHREFDAAEMSLSSYVATLQDDDPPFIALPVYTSRSFRHGGIFVNADAGIVDPEDLVGRTVGCPEYQLSACVWIRGILADHHGVPVDSVRYRTGGQEASGRPEKRSLDLPSRFDVRSHASERPLAVALAEGEIDALYSPRVPSTYDPGGGPVRRLFPDVIAAEREYHARTGIFPIMHVVVLRRDVHERDPWIARSLTSAFIEAKRRAFDRFTDTSALPYSLPWMSIQYEEACALLGEDYWSYGVEQDRVTLTTFLRYHEEQGLSERRFEPEDLFAPGSIESFVI